MANELVVGSGARDLYRGIDGVYFTASNPTPGTGIIGHAAPTTFDDTKPYLYVWNNGPNLICPMYLRLTITAASVASTNMRFTTAVDPGTPTTGKYSSGGTALVPVNTRSDSQKGSNATIYAGAVVVTAKTTPRRVLFNQQFRSVIGVVGDVYQLNFASHEQIDPASLITTGTAVANVAFGFAPVVLGPGHSFLVHQWAASQSTGPTFEVEFAYLELPVVPQ